MTTKLKEIYAYNCDKISDINEHLPTLLRYAKECDHITEFGFRTGVSTSAFLMARPKKLITYDINQDCQRTYEMLLAVSGETEFIFKNEDTTTAKIEPTDLLLIDSLHTGTQVKAELSHAPMVKKYIIFHDTITFGIVGQDKSVGILKPIRLFVEEHIQEWELKHTFTNNNGLIIIKRLTLPE